MLFWRGAMLNFTERFCLMVGLYFATHKWMELLACIWFTCSFSRVSTHSFFFQNTVLGKVILWKPSLDVSFSYRIGRLMLTSNIRVLTCQTGSVLTGTSRKDEMDEILKVAVPICHCRWGEVCQEIGCCGSLQEPKTWVVELLCIGCCIPFSILFQFFCAGQASPRFL